MQPKRRALLTLILSAVFSLAFVAKSQASSGAPVQPDRSARGLVNTAFAPNLDFYGSLPYYVESSTPGATPVLLVAGSGYLYGVYCSSGASGDFGKALDSATASGITTATQGKSLTPAVLSSVNGVTTCTAGQVCGQFTPARPVRFVNGLVFVKQITSGAAGGEDCVAYALSDAEIIAAAKH